MFSLQNNLDTRPCISYRQLPPSGIRHPGVMPPRNDRPREHRRTSSQADNGSRSRSGQRLITFINSQDPNSRSAIQRHTAYHSNAQRRDARLRSLRTTSRPRLLEWQRRAESEGTTTSQASSNSSSSMSLAPIDPLMTSRRPSPDSRGRTEEPALAAEDSSQYEPAAGLDEEDMLQYLLNHICLHTRQQQEYNDAVNFMLIDETCTQLLSAYVSALRAHNSDGHVSDTDRDNTQRFLARGTASLRNRLADTEHATSDASIQAVMLLIVYTADFGDLEDIAIHARAMRTMLRQRGGIDDPSLSSTLSIQLRSIELSRYFHLTFDCGTTCGIPRRFPQGLNLFEDDI